MSKKLGKALLEAIDKALAPDCPRGKRLMTFHNGGLFGPTPAAERDRLPLDQLAGLAVALRLRVSKDVPENLFRDQVDCELGRLGLALPWAPSELSRGLQLTGCDRTANAIRQDLIDRAWRQHRRNRG